MFDNDAGGYIKTFDTLPSGIGISDVVIAELLALQLFGSDQRTGCRIQVAVKSGLLVWVFAISQVLQFDEATVRLCRKQGMTAIFLNTRQVVADSAVVLADAVECSHRQCKFCFIRQLATGFKLSQHHCVLRCVGQHAHVFPVLGGRTHHGGPTDVDVFNRIFQSTSSLGNCRFKRVEVNHQQVNGVNLVLSQCSHVFGKIAARQ